MLLLSLVYLVSLESACLFFSSFSFDCERRCETWIIQVPRDLSYLTPSRQPRGRWEAGGHNAKLMQIFDPEDHRPLELQYVW